MAPDSVLEYKSTETPDVERACREAVCLGQKVLLGDSRDMDDVLEAIKKIQNSAGELKE